MKELTIVVPNEMAHPLEELAKWMPEVEIVKSVETLDANDNYDLCFKAAIESLQRNRVIIHPRDLAWVMMGIEQDLVNELKGFSSTRGFIAYLNIIGISRLPSNTALFNALKLVDGVYPEWEFADEPDVNEKRRRKEVYQLFLVAFNRAKKRMVEQKGEQRL